MPNLGATEIIIIAVVILVLFGAKKMPDAARSLGRSMRIFKSETKGLHEDDDEKRSGHRGDDHESEQPRTGAQPQQLSSGDSDQPAVNGKVVNRDQAHESR